MRALFLFLSKRYSSDGKNLRMDMRAGLLTFSTSNTNSPTLTIFCSDFFLLCSVGSFSPSGQYVIPSGKLRKRSAVMRAFTTLRLLRLRTMEAVGYELVVADLPFPPLAVPLVGAGYLSLSTSKVVIIVG